MKCPSCGYNQKAKYGQTCGGCKYEFAFNPKDSRMKGMTDGKFAACINSASQNDTVYFTRNQLYAAYCRRMKESPTPYFVGGVGALAIAGLLVTSGATSEGVVVFILIASVVGLVCLVKGISCAQRKTTMNEFKMMLDHWFSHEKTIEKLLRKPALHEPPPNWSEPDIYDYGVERLLIVERDILVDLFVLNGVHAEQKMLVLAESGYPNYLLPVARRLLEEHPELPVFLLHDASSHGVGMKQRLRDSGLLPLDGRPLTDLGMFPDDFDNLKRTKHFDPDNSERTLPVDAMLLPFMTMGLGVAMTENIALGTMIAEQHTSGSTSSGGVGYDFG